MRAFVHHSLDTKQSRQYEFLLENETRSFNTPSQYISNERELECSRVYLKR